MRRSTVNFRYAVSAIHSRASSPERGANRAASPAPIPRPVRKARVVRLVLFMKFSFADKYLPWISWVLPTGLNVSPSTEGRRSSVQFVVGEGFPANFRIMSPNSGHELKE